MVLKKTLTLVQTLASLDVHGVMVYRRGFDNRATGQSSCGLSSITVQSEEAA